MVTLTVRPNVTADLAALGWLPTSDLVDKEIIERALTGLIDQAITTLVTPLTAIEGCRVAPLRVTPVPIASGSCESARLSPKVTESFERGDSRNLGLGCMRPSEVLGEADAVADIVEDKPAEGQPRAEEPQTSAVDGARLWGQRLTLWQRWKMWMPEWGPRPDQDGCQAPDYLL